MFNNLHHKNLSCLAVAGTATLVSLVACDEGRARKYNKNMQNKANSPSVKYDTTAYSTRTYKIFVLKSTPKNKAKQTQNEPNFSPKLALFSRNEPNFKPNSVKIGNLYRLNISKSVFRFYSVSCVLRSVSSFMSNNWLCLSPKFAVKWHTKMCLICLPFVARRAKKGG